MKPLRNPNALHNAARAGDVAQVRSLLAEHNSAADFVNGRDQHSRTPLHLASWAGHKEIVQLLIAAGAQLGAAAADDINALHFASQKGHKDVCRMLINAGMHVNAKNRKGQTPLHFAAQNGHVEVVQFLLERKADPRAKDKSEKTPSDLTKSDEIKEILRQSVASIEEAANVKAKDRAEGNVGGFKKRHHGKRKADDVEEGEEGGEDAEGIALNGVGPALPPHLMKAQEEAGDEGGDEGIALDNVGPMLPPHLMKAQQQQGEEETGGAGGQIGPAGPPATSSAAAAKRAKFELSYDDDEEDA